jgi:hypothetical protein
MAALLLNVSDHGAESASKEFGPLNGLHGGGDIATFFFGGGGGISQISNAVLSHKPYFLS